MVVLCLTDITFTALWKTEVCSPKILFSSLFLGLGGAMRDWVFGLGFWCVWVFCVGVLSFASPGTNNLSETVRKSQSLGSRFGARVEETRGGSSVSRISVLVLLGWVFCKLLTC